MDKNNNKKRKNLIQEFLTYTGSDPSTNEIIRFLAIKNAEYLAKNEANHGQFSKEERKDLSSLPMWNIKFEDGTVFGAYPEEIIPSEMKANGYRELDELADLIRDILEKNNFNLYGDIEEQNRGFCLEFGQATPEGEDWNETIWFNGTLEIIKMYIRYPNVYCGCL